MREIQLTQGQVAIVDNEDFEKLNQFKWFAFKKGNTFYAQRHMPMINGQQPLMIYMHHEVLGKPPVGLETDHKDGDGLHNFRSNLWFVTHRQNMQKSNRKNKSSKFPGVYWHKAANKWQAQIMITGKYKYLGIFTTEVEAFEAYK